LEGIEPDGGHRVALPVIANENVEGASAKFDVAKVRAGVFCVGHLGKLARKGHVEAGLMLPVATVGGPVTRTAQ
jgi:hypothetical protein